MSVYDLIEVLVYLDPPESKQDADREAENIVNLLVRAGYDAAVSDVRNEEA